MFPYPLPPVGLQVHLPPHMVAGQPGCCGLRGWPSPPGAGSSQLTCLLAPKLRPPRDHPAEVAKAAQEVTAAGRAIWGLTPEAAANWHLMAGRSQGGLSHPSLGPCPLPEDAVPGARPGLASVAQPRPPRPQLRPSTAHQAGRTRCRHSAGGRPSGS